MEKVIRLTYASSLTNLCSVNSSFDRGVLRIAYHGDNNNKTSISKDAFERCIKTMYCCPVVCRYDRETDSLGGHDMEVVRDNDGALMLINATEPVGVIPESANVWWDTVVEDDGTEHEYLFTEALLWKRQEAYRKIKKDGITAHSMEITVKNGEMIDGVFHIYDFEFTAFTLIGVAPCFESAALELYAKQDFKKQFAEMMQELKESYHMIGSSQEDNDIHLQKYSTEGGEEVLQEKTELAAKYGIDIESLDYSLEDFSMEELEEKFNAMKNDVAEQNQDIDHGEGAADEQKFALASNIIAELVRMFDDVVVEREWGECRRYVYVDCDFDAHEVYCWDTNDWLLYGFAYQVDGDAVVIDYESKKRKKYAIVDFDDGDQQSPFATVFAQMEQVIHDGAQWEEKYQTASGTISTMEAELNELRRFKDDTESAAAQSEREKVFAQFDDLTGVEAYETLRENCAEYDVATLEEKCYAIRGRNGSVAKFSAENKTPKLKIDKTDMSDEPYGGMFLQYGAK